MGLEVKPSLKKYVDGLVAAAIVTSNAYTDAHIHAMIKTGTYTGNGADNRNIDIGIDLASKSNVYVVLKSTENELPRHRTEYGQGDNSMAYSASFDAANTIQNFNSTGFQVGTHNWVNENTKVFRYIVWWEE